MAPDANHLWEQILGQAKKLVSKASYSGWLATVQPLDYTNGVLTVQAASSFHAEWIEDHMAEMLDKVAAKLLADPPRIRVTWDPHKNDEEAIPEVRVVDVTPGTPVGQVQPSSPVPAGLNSLYTFSRFVVGEDNRLAQAACMAVADKPASAYNPLFLYGPTGLGKTHLMQAIAHQILSSGEKARICYTTAEQFVNEMVHSIKTGTPASFRARYRSCELLLVDDVQFLRKKKETQTEFFHTFNSLYNAGHQIVLSSDCHPNELDGLEDRLVSRFAWGLVVDVNRPGYETRVAILRKKAEEAEEELDSEVLDLIARSCTSSVRELEGAIIKLLAFSSLTRRELTPDVARKALASSATMAEEQGEVKVNPETIRDMVAQEWGVTGQALSSGQRTKGLSIPRQVAMFLIKETLNVSLQHIGEIFGGRSHSTVIHAIKKVNERIRAEEQFRDHMEELRRRTRKAS